MKKQQIENLTIVYELLDFILENPDLRFNQALWALGIANGKDLFYEPSYLTLSKVKHALSQMNLGKEAKCQNMEGSQERLKSS